MPPSLTRDNCIKLLFLPLHLLWHRKTLHSWLLFMDAAKAFLLHDPWELLHDHFSCFTPVKEFLSTFVDLYCTFSVAYSKSPRLNINEISCMESALILFAVEERRNSVTAFTIGGNGRTEFAPSSSSSGGNSRQTATLDRRYQAEQELSQAALYILCEKNQSKVINTPSVEHHSTSSSSP